MKSALLLGPGQLEMRDLPSPVPAAGEVIVKIESALTCGTDLKTYRRGHPKFPFPFAMGHECSGIISAVGSGVRGWQEGQAIMVVPTAPCLACRPCLRGHHNLCLTIMERFASGCFAEHYRVPAPVVEQNLFVRPGHVQADRAAFLEPLSCVVAGQRHVPLQGQDTVVVTGCGTIGLLHVLLAKQRGCGRIIVAGRHRQRLELARSLGADHVLDVDQVDTVAAVRDLTDGQGAEVVIECVGRPQAWEEAHRLAAAGGFVLLFGGCPAGTQAAFDTYRVHYDQLTLKGVFHFTPADVREAYRYLTEENLPVEKILTGTYPLNRLPEVIQKLDQGEGIKYAIVP